MHTRQCVLFLLFAFLLEYRSIHLSSRLEFSVRYISRRKSTLKVIIFMPFIALAKTLMNMNSVAIATEMHVNYFSILTIISFFMPHLLAKSVGVVNIIPQFSRSLTTCEGLRPPMLDCSGHVRTCLCSRPLDRQLLCVKSSIALPMFFTSCPA